MEMAYCTSYKLHEKKKNIAIIPVGSVEQHGPHLPLGTDTIIPYELAKRISKNNNDKVIIAPPIFYGRSYFHKSFLGTISIRGEILVEFIEDVLCEFARNGVKKIILMNGHGGNVPSIKLAVEKFYRESSYEAKIFLVNWWELPNVKSIVNVEKDIHAGRLETSIMLALGYEIKNELIIDGKHTSDLFEEVVDVGQFTKSGVIGSPTESSKSEGHKIIDEVVAKVMEIINNEGG